MRGNKDGMRRVAQMVKPRLLLERFAWGEEAGKAGKSPKTIESIQISWQVCGKKMSCHVMLRDFIN